VEGAGYGRLLNDWAMEHGGIRGSVRYHLRALDKLAMVKIHRRRAARPAKKAKVTLHPAAGIPSVSSLSSSRKSLRRDLCQIPYFVMR
jgi:hypothetical protein